MIDRRWLLTLALLGLVDAAIARAQVFELHVVDSQTGRGVPLVEVKSLDGTTWVADSNGIVAIDEPSRLGVTLHFDFLSYGYQPRNQTIFTAPGGTAQSAINRHNRAERLYRVTGAGIYEDSVQVGATTRVTWFLVGRTAPIPSVARCSATWCSTDSSTGKIRRFA